MLGSCKVERRASHARTGLSIADALSLLRLHHATTDISRAGNDPV
jgi:hypothetical protein